jgi:hypothetical protein
MVAVIDPRPLLRVDVRGWGPLGAAGEGGAFGGDAGLPAAGPVVDEGVAGVAAQRQLIDVGVAALASVVDVMNRGHGGGGVAAGPGASALGGDQRKPLIGGGKPFDAPQVERSAVVIEQRQHRVGAFGHPECVPDRDRASGGRGDDAGGVLQLIEAHRDDRRHGQPAVGAHRPGPQQDS